MTTNQSRITFFILWFMILCLKKTENRPNFDQFKEILGQDFYLALKEIEPDVMLDHTILVFLNDVPL